VLQYFRYVINYKIFLDPDFKKLQESKFKNKLDHSIVDKPTY